VSSVRVRIAPSPTGYTHVGNLRTAVFNWLLARRHGGAFIWRVEDTDRKRFVEGALEDFRQSLDWLGLTPDEGPFTGGPFAPYTQSQRLDGYRTAAEYLLRQGAAYRCFCPPRDEPSEEVEVPVEELAASADGGAATGPGARAASPSGGYDRRCRKLPTQRAEAMLASGASFTLRLRMPLEGTLELDDAIHGRVTWDAAAFTDPVIMKSDGYPTYHLAVVVDDAAMGITHVLRADEWMGTAPFHLQLYDALGHSRPVFAHVPMVLNPDGRGKLAKRKTVGADAAGSGNATAAGGGIAPAVRMTQVREFRAAGYLPEAMFNFLALLGWSFSGDRDVFTRQEALERFDLADVHKSGARWDQEKLDWMNGHYIRAMDIAELGRRLHPFLAAAGYTGTIPGGESAESKGAANSATAGGTDERLTAIAGLVRERITTLSEAAGWVDWLWTDVSPPPDELVNRKLGPERSLEVLEASERMLADVPDWTHEAIEAGLRGLAERMGLKPGPMFGPLRVATTGRTVAPPLFETLALLGRPSTLERLAAARRILEAAEVDERRDPSA